MADLAAIADLYAWMKERGDVLQARAGDIELRLADRPIAALVASEQPDSSPESPEDAERRDLENLLHSSGADVTPFLRGAKAV